MKQLHEQAEWVTNIIFKMGGMEAVACYLKTSKQSVCQWKTHIPYKKAIQLYFWSLDEDMGMKLSDFVLDLKKAS